MMAKDKAQTIELRARRRSKANGGGGTTIREAIRHKGMEVPNGKPTPNSSDDNPHSRRDRRERDEERDEQYREFFSLYNVIVQAKGKDRCPLRDGLTGSKRGMCFLSLGFVPGPACILRFDGEKIRVTAATADVKEELKIPTPWTTQDGLPKEIQEAIDQQVELMDGLGSDLSPWNFGIAGRSLKGEVPRKYLAMGLTCFSWARKEQLFGIVLEPTKDEGEVEVKAVYNPANLPAPAKGDVFTVEELMRKTETPFSKLIRTWAKMESEAQRDQHSHHPQRR